MNESKRILNQSDMAAKVNALLDDARIPLSKAPVIVALSGGADSVALLCILVEMGCDCRAAHCNFHLRGSESNRDMAFVVDLCRQLDVDLYVKDFDVPAQMAKTGESVEMACRTLRYQWFDELLDRERAGFIAVGHHREDRAETLILNLMRGAGIDGLTSMRLRNGNILRPLLPFSRAQIEDYLAFQQIGFVTDSTNASNQFRRNSIRNRVFPLLNEIFGDGAVDSIIKSIENLERTRSIYIESIEKKSKDYSVGSEINLAALIEHEPHPEIILYEILKPRGFNFPQILGIIQSASKSGLEFYGSNNIKAELSHGKLNLTDCTGAQSLEDAHSVNILRNIELPVCINSTIGSVTEFNPANATHNDAFFDLAHISKSDSWQLRHYRRGDRIVPFGSKKSKLLSDIFTNAKLNASQKRNIWLLTCNGTIVWALGLKNSAFATIGPATKNFVHLQYITQ